VRVRNDREIVEKRENGGQLSLLFFDFSRASMQKKIFCHLFCKSIWICSSLSPIYSLAFVSQCSRPHRELCKNVRTLSATSCGLRSVGLFCLTCINTNFFFFFISLSYWGKSFIVTFRTF
jgi:hypothetical protein